MKYAVRDIYEMRRLTEQLFTEEQLARSSMARGPGPHVIEEQLLTFMANETTPQELRDELERLKAERWAQA